MGRKILHAKRNGTFTSSNGNRWKIHICDIVLDTESKKWQSMPPLSAPRYVPATQLWRRRLDVMGGSKENRHTPGLEHWSLAVKNGKTLEKNWQTEVPIPSGGPHRLVLWSMIGFWS